MATDRSVHSAAWVNALSDPARPLVFPLHGYDAVGTDWGYRDRVLPDHLMYLVTAGSIVGRIEGEPIVLSAGSHLWMQPGARHTFARGPDPAPLALYFVRFRIGRPGREVRLEGRSHQQWDAATDLRGLMDDLNDELGTRLPHRDARLRGLLLAMCTAALRQSEGRMAPFVTGTAGTLSRTQRQLIESHVREHLADRPTPADLAELVQLSPDYFSRLFTRTFGVPPRAWLVHERMRRGARSLTESVQNITEVARSIGYDDVSAFSHQFKQRYGVSPRAYRGQQP